MHLHGLFHGDKTGLFQGWKLRWDPAVPPNCQVPDVYNNISWKEAQTQGTNYFQNYIKPLHSNKIFKNILWNLSPYEGLTRPIKKGKKVKLDKDLSQPEPFPVEEAQNAMQQLTRDSDRKIPAVPSTLSSPDEWISWSTGCTKESWMLWSFAATPEQWHAFNEAGCTIPTFAGQSNYETHGTV